MADMNSSRAFFHGMHKKLFSRRHLERELAEANYLSLLADYAELSKILRGKAPDRKFSMMGGGK